MNFWYSFLHARLNPFLANYWHVQASQDVWTDAREYRVTVTNTDARRLITPGGYASAERYVIPKRGNDGYPRPIFFPSSEMPQVMRWKGYWIQVTRKGGQCSLPGPVQGGCEMTITIFTRRKQVLDTLIEEARQHYIKSSKPPGWACPSNTNLSITATFRQGDWVYDWILEYLSNQGVWNNTTDVTVTSNIAEKKWGLCLGRNDQDERHQAYYLPTGSMPFLWRYNGTWIQIVRTSGTRDYRTGREEGGTLTLTLFTTQKTVLDELVTEAAAQYSEISKRRVTVHIAEGYGDWGTVITKQIRPMDSVILPKGLIEIVVDDLREFMETKDWYSAAGIPWRKGVLLWGPPGTGKSTTVHAIAGELQLEVYFVSLSNALLDDNGLRRLVSATPPRSILLLEDIDCAFPSRDADDAYSDQQSSFCGPLSTKTGVTLSGLLNVIDSVSSQEGRIVFATTNHIDRLDPALMRPGRIDLRIEYKLTNREQITRLFKRFYSHELMNKARHQSADGVHTPKSILPTETSNLIRTSDDSTFVAQLPSPETIAELAESFGAKIPEGQFSVAQLQGFLLSKKKNPFEAVETIEAWVQQQRKEIEKKEH
ncbi:hypothetical protein FRC02_001183 [Tulasnella sp. 418]|nr:hypothetical protein FRC02_001183 [Tulasnella sp. 418]